MSHLHSQIQLQVSFVPHPKSGLGTIARTLQAVQTEDIQDTAPYLERQPAVALSDLGGARTSPSCRCSRKMN